MPDIIKTATTAAQEAASIIKSSYGKVSALSDKNPLNIKDYVTNVDKEAEQAIRKVITNSFPTHSILGEEYGNSEQVSEYKWIIDPIDGTKNFMRELGQFAISIGISKNNKPYAGIIYDPLDDVFITAVVGCGAKISKGILSLSNVDSLNDACIAINFGKTSEIRTQSLSVIEELMTIVPIIRTPGSTAFAIKELVQGKYDALIDNGDYWDFAAGLVILSELGGTVTTWNGGPVTEESKYVVWTNGKIDTEIFKLIERRMR